jgi:hypothetical protein
MHAGSGRTGGRKGKEELGEAASNDSGKGASNAGRGRIRGEQGREGQGGKSGE